MYKKIEKDAPQLDWFYTFMAKNDAQYIDVLTVGNERTKEILDNCFYCENKTELCGIARTDDLINGNTEKAENVRKCFNLTENDYVVLYAPTFRNKQPVEDSVLDNEELKKTFEKITDKNVKILYRFHPNIAKKAQKLKFESYVQNATSYPDIQDLVLVADIMITDYSSCMFDMMETNKPCIIFTKDDKKYLQNERGVYYPASSFPFPAVSSFEELKSVIENLKTSFGDYQNKINAYKKEIGDVENGHSCENLYKIMTEKTIE